MAQYGVVLSGFTAGVLAYQKGVFGSFLPSSSSNSQHGQSTFSTVENQLNEAGQRKEAVKTAQYDGPRYYETLITCPRF